MKCKSSLELKIKVIYLSLMEEGFKKTWKILEEEWKWYLFPSHEREEELPSFVSFWSLMKLVEEA